jgi:hypothetical protein
MAKPIVIHTEDLNSYGFWMKTDGADLSRFNANPVLLWNHHRTWAGKQDEVLPIGILKDLRIEDGRIVGTPEFDEDDEFALKIKRKYDKGHVRASSCGAKIIKTSEDPQDLKPGQRRPTVLNWELREVSLTDIPSNPSTVQMSDHSSVMLYDESGDVVNLSAEDNCALPLMSLSDKNPDNDMELKVLAAQLGLTDSASLNDVQQAITQLKQKADQMPSLKAELDQLKKAENDRQKKEAQALVDQALSDRKITGEQKEHFLNLFDKDFDSTKSILESLPKLPKLNDQTNTQKGSLDGDGKYEGKTFTELRKENPKLLTELKEKDFEIFKDLYKAEFGKDYKVK